MTNEHDEEMAARAVQLYRDAREKGTHASREEFEAAYWELPREWRVCVDKCLGAEFG